MADLKYNLTEQESKAAKAIMGRVRELQTNMARAQGALDGIVQLIASQQEFKLTGAETFSIDDGATELTVALPAANDADLPAADDAATKALLDVTQDPAHRG